jgi:hypothetical protein
MERGRGVHGQTDANELEAVEMGSLGQNVRLFVSLLVWMRRKE